MRSRASAPPGSRIGVWLVACALLIRLLIPSGFMWAAGAAGALPTLIVCSGQTMAAPHAMAGHRAGPHEHDHDHRHGHQREPTSDHPCPFAGAGVTLAMATIAGDRLVPPPATRAVLGPADVGARAGRGLAAPPPPKTGPPILH